MRTYPIEELKSVLDGFVRSLRSKPSMPLRPLKVYEPFWPAARGATGFAVQDIEVAEDWEDMLVLTPEDKREYRKWVNSLGKSSS